MQWQNLNEICTTCTVRFTGMSSKKSFFGLSNCLKWLFPVFYPVPVLTLFNCVPTLPTPCLLSKKSFTKPEIVPTEEQRHPDWVRSKIMATHHSWSMQWLILPNLFGWFYFCSNLLGPSYLKKNSLKLSRYSSKLMVIAIPVTPINYLHPLVPLTCEFSPSIPGHSSRHRKL